MDNDEKSPEDFLDEIKRACTALGWEVGMNEVQPGVRGLIIGQRKFVEEVVEQLGDFEEYEIYEIAPEDAGLH